MRNIFGSLGVAFLLLVVTLTASADNGLGRHKKLYAVPAPSKVVIDGKLDDWDLSGQIMTYVISETSDMQSAKFAVMYDKTNLYLSAVVRDPSPMMNRHDPKADGDRGWDADACQFRLCLDPTQPYPAKASVYDAAYAEIPSYVHLTMWDYTDKNEPVLQIRDSMRYKLPRKEWGPYGIVPHSDYQAKYVKAADGRGYIFEYAIPWSTLGAKAPLKGGDLVSGTVQFDYGAPDGLHTAGGSAWCYDLMAGPGTTYQNAAVWGKLIFSNSGHLPKQMVEQGVMPEKPLPLKFAYDLPEDSQITIQLVDKENYVRRILVAQGDRRAGHNVELWDGLDDSGKLLPAGDYVWKGIYHKPLSQKVLFSPQNSGQPVYKTDDGTGSWGGDHGDPRAIIALDGGIIMSWNAAEAGSGIIRTDLNGKKQWGTLLGAQHLATDGKRIFTAGDEAFNKGAGVTVIDAADSRPLDFGNGNARMDPPAGGTDDTNLVTGIAYSKGVVYVSYRDRNLIALYDATSGDPKTTWTIPSAGHLVALQSGNLIAVSGGSVVEIADGKATPFVSTHLDDPRGITVGADGTVYVANGGALQNISVFDSSGNYLRSIGKAGGRPRIGRYDPSGMLEPDGIAIDKNGHLWVPEMLDSPKRISEWDAATGALVNEFFGAVGYFGYSYIDPQHPDEIYCHNTLWKIDWSKNTCAPYTTIWRQTSPNMMPPPGPSGYSSHPVFFTAANGHQYSYGNGSYISVLSERDGDLYKPFAAIITITSTGMGYADAPHFPAMADASAYPDGYYLWQDRNGDQMVQANEITRIPNANTFNFKIVDENLNAWTGPTMLAPVSVSPTGIPLYDVAATKPSAVALDSHAMWEDNWYDPQDHGAYDLGGELAKYSADGKKDWAFPGMVSWGSAVGLPIQEPGRLWGVTQGLGVAGNFTGVSDYFGTFHLFTRDGIYVGMLMRDRRDGKGYGPDVDCTEVVGGQLVKPDGMDRYFLISGASDARVTEISGLDTIKPLPGGVLSLTPADVSTVSSAIAEYNASASKSSRWSIARGRSGLNSAEPISKALDGSRSFTVRGAYDATNFYISYEVVSPNDLVNTYADPNVLFKGGNCLDIQLAANPAADPKRKTPAPGDVRILVTRKDGKPFAVIYRPKVAGFTGTPVVLHSPANQESFDSIAVTDKVGLEYTKTADGYTAVVTIPQVLTGLSLKSGTQFKADIGVIYGNATGNQTSARSYWINNGFNANIISDVPSESLLEPAEWGMAAAE